MSKVFIKSCGVVHITVISAPSSIEYGTHCDGGNNPPCLNDSSQAGKFDIIKHGDLHSYVNGKHVGQLAGP